ncbi:MAG: AI-2E family transporter [Gammaproteobacteria bacterium]
MTDAQKWLVLTCGVLGCWLIYLLAPILTPFLVGALLAYLGDPIVDQLERLKLSRTLAVIIVFACMLFAGLVLLLILIPLIEGQLSSFFNKLPRFVIWLQDTLIPRLTSLFGLELENIDLSEIKQSITNNWQDVGSILSQLIIKVSQSGKVVIAWLVYLVLIPIVTFYLLRDWDILVARIHELMPRRHVSVITRLARECDEVLDEFLHGQLLVMLGQGIIYTIGLWIVGLEFALLIGMLAGLVSFVPYLGFVVGFSVASIAVLMQYHDLVHLVYVALVFGVGQAIEGMLLSPILVGDRIGLHPVAVIFAVMAGGQLFGFFGVLLALPVAAIIVVLLRYLREQYLVSSFYTP